MQNSIDKLLLDTTSMGIFDARHTGFVPALKKKDPDPIFHVDGAPASLHSFKKVKVASYGIGESPFSALPGMVTET